jgi:hypothetical protein
MTLDDSVETTASPLDSLNFFILSYDIKLCDTTIKKADRGIAAYRSAPQAPVVFFSNDSKNSILRYCESHHHPIHVVVSHHPIWRLPNVTVVIHYHQHQQHSSKRAQGRWANGYNRQLTINQ